MTSSAFACRLTENRYRACSLCISAMSLTGTLHSVYSYNVSTVILTVYQGLHESEYHVGSDAIIPAIIPPYKRLEKHGLQD